MALPNPNLYSRRSWQRDRSILFVSTALMHGGAEVQVAELAKRFRRRNWRVGIASLVRPSAFVEELQRDSVDVFSLDMRPGFPDPRGLFRLRRIIQKWNPTVVHSHLVHGNLLARFARLTTKMNVLICSAHSMCEGGRFRELAYRLTDGLATVTTNVSEAAVRRYIEVGAAPRDRICAVPNGVDVKRYKVSVSARNEMRRRLGIDEAQFVWLAVGRLELPKDYPNMLRAFGATSRELPSCLVIAGAGRAEEEIRSLAGVLGVSSRVRLLGLRKDVSLLMGAADAYVMSSAWEGLPMVLLEASSSGLPIVATNVGGNAEIVLDGISGFLVSPRNHHQLAAAMLRVMKAPSSTRRQMGAMAQAHVESNYEIDHIVTRWEEIYSGLLEQANIRLVDCS